MTDTLAGLRRNRDDIKRLLDERWQLIDQARTDGKPWTAIGEALGMSYQSAQRWYTNTPATRRAMR